MTQSPKQDPKQVPKVATPTGEADPYGWVERSVWTERMLGCLRQGGPEGGKKWLNAFFDRLELLSLEQAHAGYLSAHRGHR